MLPALRIRRPARRKGPRPRVRLHCKQPGRRLCKPGREGVGSAAAWHRGELLSNLRNKIMTDQAIVDALGVSQLRPELSQEQTSTLADNLAFRDLQPGGGRVGHGSR